MGRRPVSISDAQWATIESMAKAGRSAVDIAAATGVSARTVSRRVRDMMGSRRARSSKKAPAAGPKQVAATKPAKKRGSGKGPKADAQQQDPLADLDAMIAELEEMAELAKDAENLATVAAAHRLRLSAIGLRERLRPAPPPDIDAMPDMV